MGALIWFIFCSLVLLGAFAYLHLPRWGSTVLMGVYLLSQPWGWLGWLIWPLFLLVAAVINLPELRMQVFSNRLFHWFFEQLPPMSKTEKEAIDAGDVGWEKEIFQGNPQWQQFNEMPKPSLREEEQAFLDNQVETLCAMLNDWEIVQEKKDLPIEVWN
jgi:acyl-CoA dehydrogenase